MMLDLSLSSTHSDARSSARAPLLSSDKRTHEAEGEDGHDDRAEDDGDDDEGSGRSACCQVRCGARGVRCSMKDVGVWLYLSGTRTVLTGVVLLIALFVPNFSRILAFCGSLLSFFVSIIFPPACYIVLCRERDQLSPLAVAGHWALAGLGVVLAVLGVVFAVITKT